MIVLESTPPPGWVRLPGNVDGVPLWKRCCETCYVATGDMDLLRFIDAALARFDEMSGSQLRDFIAARR